MHIALEIVKQRSIESAHEITIEDVIYLNDNETIIVYPTTCILQRQEHMGNVLYIFTRYNRMVLDKKSET